MKTETDISKYRTLHINKPQLNRFSINSIITAKYNFMTFLPLFLFNQFRSYSNVFFLIVSIVQQLPGVSPMGRYTTLIPLIIILTVTALKELFEDIFRHRDDKKMNSRLTEVWKNRWTNVQWKHVQVGEILRVRNNLEFPADLVLVCSSELSSGIAYVETVNLDGESNLKIRRTPNSLVINERDAGQLRGMIVCDQPNEIIYHFNGMIVLPNKLKISINEEQLLLRGAILRNTDWIIGVVVYTGNDTKIWRNSQEKEIKRSNSSDMVNWHMMVLFTLFFLLTFMNSILYIIWNYKIQDGTWYLPMKRTSAFTIETFLTFAVGYSYLIPISLQIYLEIVRLFQASYINNDEKMYSQETRTYAKAMTSNLNSDLGEVKYIFTDKTGTLTQNILEFKECSIGGTVYQSDNLEPLAEQCQKNSICHHFFIAICVAPGVVPISDRVTKELKYYSSSTDQLALIAAAKKLGFELKQRTYGSAQVSVQGNILKYKILADIEFTSERRRSSVIVRNPENRIFLYVLGADDTIFKRLSSKTAFRNETSQHIVTFAFAGLRTMCLAMSEITEMEFQKWNKYFHRAKLSMVSRQAQIGRVADKIERNLKLVGAAACEDKLQDQVPQTISTLIAAGIKVWMLTGDKQETAVNIGYSTKLLSKDSNVFILNSEDLIQLQKECVQISQKLPTATRPVMVINGNSLTMLLKSKYAEYFMTLSMNCESVICCRMIPIQKAQIVHYVQNRTNRVTLAIGDGANDVAMIQTASVGVGISGVEGLQAVYAADYSIAVFKHLSRLLLVHGTWNYNRVCKIIYFIYYKNLPIGLTMFYISYASGWSGSSIFDDWAFTLYNVVFTDGATLALGMLEKDYTEDILTTDPLIYRQNNWSDVRSFYVCLLNGLFHTILVLYLTINLLDSNVLWKESYNDNYVIQGHILYTNILIIVVMKCFLHLMNWTKLAACLILSTALLWFPVLLIYNYFWTNLPLDPEVVGTTSMLFSTPVFWLTIIFVPFSVLFLDIVITVFYRAFYIPILKQKAKPVDV